MTEVTCICDCRNQLLGEGAYWNARGGAFWWVDVIPPSTLYRFVPATERVDRWPLPEMVTAMAMRRTARGWWLRRIVASNCSTRSQAGSSAS